MRVQILGGFLGAGKTSVARSLAAELRKAGDRVAIITNDQGQSIVDTELCRDDAEHIFEIGGGCFCCRYPELESALLAARTAGATVAIAEAVGSCTDLVATVLEPLGSRCGTAFVIEPLAVVVDPWRVTATATASLGGDIDFLFQKQIEEADVVLLSRADLQPPDITSHIRRWNLTAPILSVSGRSGAGIMAWWSAHSEHRSSLFSIDYDRYAKAESLLGWCNARVRLSSPAGLDPRDTVARFLQNMASEPVAHVKVTGIHPAGNYGGAITRRDGDVELHGTVTDRAPELRWLVNARVALSPEDLERSVRQAVIGVAGVASVFWEELDCFSPARPEPTYRYATRCKSDDNASCCAAFYQREDVRRLLGDSYHPGGTDLTMRMMRAAHLGPNLAVLDVACGTGESLRAIANEWDIRGIGIDSAPCVSSDSRIETKPGDAHRLPCDGESVDVVLCECALSTFADQRLALREMYRVLRPGGFLAVSDMVVGSGVPDSLREWVHSGTCLERAMSSAAYRQMMCDAGFVIADEWDASDGLTELLNRIKRNLIGWITASASQTVSAPLPFDVREARTTLKEAAKAVADGSIRYGAFIGRKPA